MDLKEIFSIIRKYVLIVIACVIVVTGVAMFVIWRKPTTYTAVSRIEVRTDVKNYGGYDQLPILSELAALDNYRNVQTQAERLKSNVVLERTYEKMKLTRGQIQSLALKVAPENDSDIIRMEVTSTDPELAKKFANNLAEVFLDFSRQEYRSEADKKAKYMKSQMDKVDKQIREKRMELKIFKRDNIKGDLDSETENITKTYYDFRNMKKTAQVELQETEEKIKQFQHELGMQPENTQQILESRNTLIDQLRSQQTNLEIELARASQKFGPSHPEIKSLEEQKDIIKRRLQHEYETLMITSQTTKERNPVHDDMTKELARLTADRAALTNKVGALSSLEAESKAPLKYVSEKEKLLVEFEIEIEKLENKENSLLQKYNDLSITKNLPMDAGYITDYAKYAVDTNRAKKLIAVIIAVMGGIFMGLIIAFIREYFDDTLYSSSDIEEALQLPVLGQIPLEKNLGTDLTVCADRPNTPVAESFRALRNRVKYLLAENDFRTFMLTSSAVQEGKSFITLNLAITMAQYGHKILLVDADMRRPTLHKVFDIPNQGISNVVMDNEDVTDLIVETDIPNLSVLTSGPLPLTEASPVISSEIFEDQRVHDMINLLKISYDYVIFDTPPILAVTDVLTLSAHVPAVLFVVSSGDMQRGDVVTAKQMLESTGVKILGSVLNRTQHSVSYYRYLYYYYDKGSGSKKYRYARY